MTDQPRRPAEGTASALVEMLSLALPTVAQMASYTVMQFIDIWMLSRLGGAAPTAASNAGMLSFSLVALGLGVLVLVNTLVSQSFGRQDWAKCGQYLWAGIWLGLVMGLAMLPLRLIAGQMFSLFHHPAEQAAMETTYYRIVILASAVKLCSTAMGQFAIGIDRPRSVLVSALLGVFVNAVAAWCFVLGHWGFHRYGIVGSAWCQNIGVTTELCALAVLALRKSIREKYSVLPPTFYWNQFLTLIRIGLPSGLQFFSDVLAWSIFCNGVIGILGAAAMEGNTFMLRYMVVSFMPAYGFSAAVTALVGRYIGRGRLDISVRRAHLGFVVTFAYILLCAATFILARGPMMRLFTHDPQVIRIGGMYLIYAAIYEIFDAMYIVYSGALRGAGDTLVPAIVMASLCWTISVGGGYVLAIYFFPQFGYGGPWFIGCVYGALLGIYMMIRFLRGKWKLICLEKPGAVHSEETKLQSLTSQEWE